jgi:hypothetical protein
VHVVAARTREQGRAAEQQEQCLGKVMNRAHLGKTSRSRAIGILHSSLYGTVLTRR